MFWPGSMPQPLVPPSVAMASTFVVVIASGAAPPPAVPASAAPAPAAPASAPPVAVTLNEPCVLGSCAHAPSADRPTSIAIRRSRERIDSSVRLEEIVYGELAAHVDAVDAVAKRLALHLHRRAHLRLGRRRVEHVAVDV